MAHITTYLLIGFFLSLSYHIFQTLKTRHLAHRLGCLPPASHYPHKDPLGLDLIIKITALRARAQSIPYFASLFKLYGPTWVNTCLDVTVINTIDPENLRAIYGPGSMRDWGVEPFRLPAMGSLCGRGFLTTDGETWEHSRTLLKPLFSKAIILDLSRFEGAVEEVLGRLPTNGETVDLAPIFNELFLNTASDFILGRPLNGLADEADQCPIDSQTFLRALHGAQWGMGLRFILGKFSFLLPSRKFKAMCATSHEFINYYIDKALEIKREGKIFDVKDDLKRRKTLLQVMTEQTEDKTEIRSQILPGIMAGQDTTSVLLANTIFLLSRHPAFWTRLRTEVLEMGDREVTFDSLKSFKFLQSILAESLRLFLLFPQMGRVALPNTILPKGGGPDGQSPLYIPSGSRTISSFYALHRNPSIFGPDSEAFNPDRWERIKPGVYENMSFGGGGPRACVGKQKALAEAGLVLVMMARRWREVKSRDQMEWAGVAIKAAANRNGCLIGLVV